LSSDEKNSSQRVDSSTLTAANGRTTTYDVIGDRKKKSRTVFSRRQVFELEATFAASRYLSSIDRCRLADRLQLSETQVKIWFQNRRNKWKRQTTDNHVPASLGAPAGEGSAWNGGGEGHRVGLMSATSALKQGRRSPGGVTSHRLYFFTPLTIPTCSIAASLRPSVVHQHHHRQQQPSRL